MSVNHSSSTNDSLPPQYSSSNFFLSASLCFDSAISGHIHSVLTLTTIVLLLPLSVFVLNLGFQRWKQQRSVSSAAVMSFSDFYTYNMAVMELIGVLGYTVTLCSIYAHLHDMLWIGMFTGAFPWCGQMFLPILICVDRYMAAVHPITYLRLRRVEGVRIRNISTGVVWLLCFGGMGLTVVVHKYPECSLMISASLMTFILIVVTFCSLSVLCILTRPRPGEAGGNRARVDQSKRRAFHTIIIVMAALSLRFGGTLVVNVVGVSPVSYTVQCVALVITGWFTLPSSLLLPLLFLHRKGKLPYCKHNAESG